MKPKVDSSKSLILQNWQTLARLTKKKKKGKTPGTKIWIKLGCYYRLSIIKSHYKKVLC